MLSGDEFSTTYVSHGFIVALISVFSGYAKT